MLTKFASAAVLDARLAPRSGGLMRDAHRHEFAYDPRPGFLYVRSRAISSRTNDNFDNFPAEEIKKAYRTFIGKPVFVNHHNDNHRRARGVIVDAALHEDVNPDGSPDTWAEVLMEVDAVRFPMLAKAILAGEIDRTSMGTEVAFSVCSACGNKATNPLEYCQHIPRLKGKKIRRVTASGTKEDVLVYEACYGLGFFENSLLVEQPADPTAFLTGVDSRGLATVASKTAALVPVTIKASEVQVGDRLSASGKTRVSQRHPRTDKVLVQTKMIGARSPSIQQWDPDEEIRVWRDDSKTALNEVMAPAKVDTLRDDSCPVCSEHDSFDGDKCLVCGYIRPPDEFLDPDLEKAREVDLRQEQQEDAGVSPQDGVADPDQAQAGAGQAGADPTHPWLNKEMAADPDAAASPGNPWEQREIGADAVSGDPADDEDDPAKPWLSKTIKNTKTSAATATGTSQKEKIMRPTLQALADQQQMIERQSRQITALRDTVGFIADVAGLSSHPRVTAALGRIAADENPASANGWATDGGDKAPEAPAATTEQASQPSQGTDSPESIGTAPGTDVAPAATTSVESTDTVLDQPLDLNEQDVTAPVAGTEDLGEGARGQAGSGRTETDVQVGTPTNDTAFSETGWTTSSKPSEPRTIASLRLARLRMQAGIEDAGADDLALGTAIAMSGTSDESIQNEISTLAKVVTARQSATTATQNTATRHLVPRAASQAQRTVPSLAVEPQIPMQTVASAPSDDEFMWE